MILRVILIRHAHVVPRKGDVDRNLLRCHPLVIPGVVPRKGDVDRNMQISPFLVLTSVVPRKGDVDRNPISLAASVGVLGRRPPQGGRG